ncbi:hypothetical protein Thermus77420_21130 [Thermus thalpophilus]
MERLRTLPRTRREEIGVVGEAAKEGIVLLENPSLLRSPGTAGLR